MKTSNSTKLKMKVTSVNEYASTVTLEGKTEEVSYLILIDYDIGGEPTDHHVGDTFDLALTLSKRSSTYKPRAVKKSAKKPGVTVSGHCTGSGKKPQKSKITQRRWRTGNDRSVCPDCGKERAVNYDGTFRKHNA